MALIRVRPSGPRRRAAFRVADAEFHWVSTPAALATPCSTASAASLASMATVRDDHAGYVAHHCHFNAERLEQRYRIRHRAGGGVLTLGECHAWSSRSRARSGSNVSTLVRSSSNTICVAVRPSVRQIVALPARSIPAPRIVLLARLHLMPAAMMRSISGSSASDSVRYCTIVGAVPAAAGEGAGAVGSAG